MKKGGALVPEIGVPEIGELDPPPRLLMGPGPVNCDPRVLRAMAMPMLGQFDPVFTRYMGEVMALYRRVYQTENRWTFLVDGTARAGIFDQAVFDDQDAVADDGELPHFLAHTWTRGAGERHQF